MQRMAGMKLSGQLSDPNLPCSGESLLPTTGLADFDADPVMRARQMNIARLPNFEQGPDQGPSSPIKYYPGMGYVPEAAG